jgi:hypothetical protein
MSKKTCGSTGQDGEEDQPTGKSCIYRLEMRKTNRKVRMEKEERRYILNFRQNQVVLIDTNTN